MLQSTEVSWKSIFTAAVCTRVICLIPVWFTCVLSTSKQSVSALHGACEVSLTTSKHIIRFLRNTACVYGPGVFFTPLWRGNVEWTSNWKSSFRSERSVGISRICLHIKERLLSLKPGENPGYLDWHLSWRLREIGHIKAGSPAKRQQWDGLSFATVQYSAVMETDTLLIVNKHHIIKQIRIITLIL